MKKSLNLKNKEAEEFIRQLAYKYDLPVYIVRNIVVSQFKALSDLIYSNTIESNKNIRFPNLGCFYFNMKRAIKFKKLEESRGLNRDNTKETILKWQKYK